jgi:hypothetical protein
VAQTKNEPFKYGIREVIETLQTAFKEFIEEAKTLGLDKQNNSINDHIFWNDISKLNGGPFNNSHKTHLKGVDIDVRQIISKKETTSKTTFEANFFQLSSNSIDNTLKSYKDNTLKLINPTNDTRDSIGNYSRKGTRLLIQKLMKKRNPVKLANGTEVNYAEIESILFNDSVLIEEGLCSPYKDHDNHLHISFKIPKRVEDEIANNNKQNSRRFTS